MIIETLLGLAGTIQGQIVPESGRVLNCCMEVCSYCWSSFKLLWQGSGTQRECTFGKGMQTTIEQKLDQTSRWSRHRHNKAHGWTGKLECFNGIAITETWCRKERVSISVSQGIGSSSRVEG